MKSIPNSARDMWWAEQQDNDYGVTVEYVDRSPDRDEQKPGMLSDVRTIVKGNRFKDLVTVLERYGYFDEKIPGGWRIRIEDKVIASLTFAEFRESEWWDAYLTKVAKRRLDFDSSWIDSLRVDRGDDYACVEFRMPVYETVWWCSSDVPTGETVDCSLTIDNLGTLMLECGGRSHEAHIGDFIGAIEAMNALESAGVTTDGKTELTVKLNRGDA